MTFRFLALLAFISTTSIAAHHDIDAFPIVRSGQLRTVNFPQGDSPSLAYFVKVGSPTSEEEQAVHDAYYLKKAPFGPVYDPSIHFDFGTTFGHADNLVFLTNTTTICLQTLLDLVKNQKDLLKLGCTAQVETKENEDEDEG